MRAPGRETSQVRLDGDVCWDQRCVAFAASRLKRIRSVPGAVLGRFRSPSLYEYSSPYKKTLDPPGQTTRKALTSHQLTLT